MPDPRGLGLRMIVYEDRNHTRDLVNQQSGTGFVFSFNEAPIYWIYNKQTSYEAINFGSKFVAMEQAVEYFQGLCYKISMFIIPFEYPTFIYGKKQSVLANNSVPASTLNKKSK